MTMDSRLHATMRIEAWAGEVRVNLIRLAALAMFYGYHVLNELRVPRTNQIAFAIALAVAGLLAGQSVRQARRIAARISGPVLPANKVQQ